MIKLFKKKKKSTQFGAVYDRIITKPVTVLTAWLCRLGLKQICYKIKKLNVFKADLWVIMKGIIVYIGKQMRDKKLEIKTVAYVIKSTKISLYKLTKYHYTKEFLCISLIWSRTTVWERNKDKQTVSPKLFQITKHIELYCSWNNVPSQLISHSLYVNTMLFGYTNK